MVAARQLRPASAEEAVSHNLIAQGEPLLMKEDMKPESHDGKIYEGITYQSPPKTKPSGKPSPKARKFLLKIQNLIRKQRKS